MNRIKLLQLLAAMVLVIMTGCNRTEEPRQREPVRIKVQQAEFVDARERLTYSGTIEESETIPLSFSSVGTVSQVLVSEGDAVTKGQVLAKLDTTTFRGAYEMARAAEQQAQDAYNRLTQMHKNGNLPDVKYVEVETGLQQAKAAAAIARKNLDDCTLYATTDGVVGKRSVNPGMVTIPNITSITLVKIARVYAKVSIPENEIASIKKGEKAKVTIGALGALEYSGTVEEIGVLADPLAHTYGIKIGLQNTGLKIKPGMVCNVAIRDNDFYKRIIIQNCALQVDEHGKTFVFSIEKDRNRAIRKYVTTGKLFNDGAEITDGLNEGDWVVIAGQQKLADNSLVSIVNQ
jgi:membrane fusion protein, multidrug efflux system